jgi:polyferredoxin
MGKLQYPSIRSTETFIFAMGHLFMIFISYVLYLSKFLFFLPPSRFLKKAGQKLFQKALRAISVLRTI